MRIVLENLLAPGIRSAFELILLIVSIIGALPIFFLILDLLGRAICAERAGYALRATPDT